MRLAVCVSAALAVVGLAACSDTRYYLQSFNGHLQLMQSARPVEQWLEDAKTPEQLKRRLALTQRMRTFAVQELGLPDNPSYRRYADLKRRSVVWNVVAAPEFSLTLKTWCFPLLGCVGYRGYFSEADAHEEAAKLKARDLDVEVAHIGRRSRNESQPPDCPCPHRIVQNRGIHLHP